MTTPKVGQVGLEITVEFRTINCLTGVEEALPVDTATTIEICFRRPDGTTFTETAVFTPAPCGNGTGTDGKITFVSTAGTLDQEGLWYYQGHAILPDPKEFWSDEIPMQVATPIC